MKQYQRPFIQIGIVIISTSIFRCSVEAASAALVPVASKRYVSSCLFIQSSVQQSLLRTHRMVSYRPTAIGSIRSSKVPPIDVVDTQKRSYPTTSTSYQHALEILRAGVAAVDPATAISAHLSSDPIHNPHTLKLHDPSTDQIHTYHATDYDSLLVVSFGKAASTMTEQTLQILSQTFQNVPLVGCIIVTKDKHVTDDQKVHIQKLCSTWNSSETNNHPILHILEAAHPVPDQRSVEGAERILEMVQRHASPKTLVLCCISGGGSSLVTKPIPPLSLVDLQKTNQALLASGMDISQMNTIRKKLDAIKGGKLAIAAYPSTVISLILSDVIGDDLSIIASGPTAPVQVTQSVQELIKYNHLESKLSSSVLQRLMEKNSNDDNHHPIFTSKTKTNAKLCENILVGNNHLALLAAAHTAKRIGYHPIILGSTIEGEAKVVAGMYISMAEYLLQQKQQGKDSSHAAFTMMNPSSHDSINQGSIALLAGGETTVTLPPNHSNTGCLGGRNQEIALTAALILSKSKHLESYDDIVLGSLGTDGTDGPTDAAGAIVHGNTISWVESMNGGSIVGKDALQNHDAYHFFNSVEPEKGNYDPTIQYPLIKTGPTGTNVADICVVLIR